MPKIQVYKHDGVMIPTSLAKTTKAYSCPWTSKLFATKKSYTKHLKKLREERMHRNARINLRKKLGENLHSQTSFEKIIEWCELHSEWFLDNAIRMGWGDKKQYYEKIRKDFRFQITYLNVRWSDAISNTHHAPHSGVTNWSREADKPHGYPGWAGRIEWKCSHSIAGFGSDLVEGTRIHTGTGGGTSGNRYGFDVRFFADDWPGLRKSMIIDSLADKKPNNFTFGNPDYFKW